MGEVLIPVQQTAEGSFTPLHLALSTGGSPSTLLKEEDP